MKWDETRGQEGHPPALYIKRLFHWKRFGWRIDLHKMTAPDRPGCFHTHPSNAIRIILWGGYVEEIFEWRNRKAVWLPFDFGIVRPEFCHRIEGLIDDASYSLWLRGKVTDDVHLLGLGWPTDQLGSHPERN